jgi:pimeloyl-ACP methyl ester carboxylesterase
VLILCLLLAASSACGGGTNAEDDADSAVRETAVRFKTTDGRTLTGRLFGSSTVGVTLGHMYPSDAASWYVAAREMAKAGYMTLAFNFRGYGDSDGTKQVAKGALDVSAAGRYLEKRGASDVAFVGASMGGTASLVAADSDDALAIVAISAPTRFMGLDAAAAATTIQRPVLLMASRNDEAAFRSAQELGRALPNPDTKIYDGDAHGTNLLDARPEAIDEIVSFLKRYAPVARSTEDEQSQ